MAHASIYIVSLTLVIPLQLLVLLAIPLHTETFCHVFSEVLLQAEALTYGIQIYFDYIHVTFTKTQTWHMLVLILSD